MAKIAQILDYLPEVITVIREFQAIATAEDPELTDLWTEIEHAYSDQYVADATENGVERYESILEIVPKATDTLDERKFRIQAKYNEQLPYTYRAMLQRLDTLCGADGYTVALDVPGHKVTVRIRIIAQSNIDAVDEMLESIVPMNMILDLDLLYNKHSQLAAYTHAQLAAYTHDELRKGDL